jgi:hypothetical protein
MTREEWAVVKEIFEASRPLTVGDRESYLSRACPSPAMRAEVESLLEIYSGDVEFLEIPALAIRDAHLSGA